MTDYPALAERIRRAFTPFAYTCECKGSDPSCAWVLNNEGEQIRYYTMLSIAEFIEGLED